MQTTPSQTQIPGIPLGIKVVGWKIPTFHDYVIRYDGSISLSKPTESSGYALVAPDNCYSAINLKRVPLPSGWEYDGDPEKPETWYRELSTPTCGPSGSPRLGCKSGENVLGFDGNKYSGDSYTIEPDSMYKFRIFLRPIPPKMKRVLVGEWDISETAVGSGSGKPLICCLSLAENIVQRGVFIGTGNTLNGDPANFRIETRPI